MKISFESWKEPMVDNQCFDQYALIVFKRMLDFVSNCAAKLQSPEFSWRRSEHTDRSYRFFSELLKRDLNTVLPQTSPYYTSSMQSFKSYLKIKLARYSPQILRNVIRKLQKFISYLAIIWEAYHPYSQLRNWIAKDAVTTCFRGKHAMAP